MDQEFQSFGTAGPRALRGHVWLPPLVSSSVAGNEEGRAVCRSAVSACLHNKRVCATVFALDVCTVVLPLVQKIRRSVLSCNQGAPSVITNPKWGVWVCFVLNTY